MTRSRIDLQDLLFGLLLVVVAAGMSKVRVLRLKTVPKTIFVPGEPGIPA